MDKVNYETYDTDEVYDDMDANSTGQQVIFENIVYKVCNGWIDLQVRIPEAKPQPKVENEIGNKRVKKIHWNYLQILITIVQ